jgi:hypothetical protein
MKVTFTLAQANNDIVDDLPKLTVAQERRPASVLLLSLSTCGPWESAVDTTVLSFDIFLKDLLSKVPLAISSPSVSAGLHCVQYIRAGQPVPNARGKLFQLLSRCRLTVLLLRVDCLWTPP